MSLPGFGYPNTLRKPGIACRDPTAARSKPYCMLAMETRQQRNRHFRFCQSDVEEKLLSAILMDMDSWVMRHSLDAK